MDIRGAAPRRSCLAPPHPRLFAVAVAFLLSLVPAVLRAGDVGVPSEAALREFDRVRKVLGVEQSGMENMGRRRTIFGRPAEEIEGWRTTAPGERWPVDQATFDTWSGLLAKYVNFENTSRRKAGESILPMSVVSTKADGFASLFYPDRELSLESIDRYRVQGKESVYYELRYKLHPQDILSFHPLARMLINASTGRLYRFELAVDYLDARYPPATMISAKAAGKIALLALRTMDLGSYLDGSGEQVSLMTAELFFVRPNAWLGASVPSDGRVRAAWVVPFRAGGEKGGAPHLMFIDAATGKPLGGVRSTSGR